MGLGSRQQLVPVLQLNGALAESKLSLVSLVHCIPLCGESSNMGVEANTLSCQ